jgi:penicillin-binding protein 1A
LPNYVIRVATVARNAVIVALFVAAAAGGILSGVLFAYANDLPQISALDNYAPNTITRIYAADGQSIGEFAVQRRLVVRYEDIAPQLRQAIVAAEDGDFDRHMGFSISAIAARLAKDIVREVQDLIYKRQSRPMGASTITQQLARGLLPETVGFRAGDTGFAALERKVKEAIVAIQIEKRYTKREILTFYANHIHLGHGTYGVEAAARLYFGKPAKELSLDEAALIAGIIQSPARQSPFTNMDAAMRRRSYTLQRMADEEYISQADADAAKARPIVLRGQPQQSRSLAPFFVEEIRQHLEQQYGADALYEEGLSVMTTLDVALQEAANRSLDKGLRQIDKRRGYRSPARNVLSEGIAIDAFKDERWSRPIAAGDIVPAVVSTLNRAGATARLRIGRYHADLGREGVAWTNRAVADLVKPGDVIEVSILKIDEGSSTATVALEQRPIVQGAVVVIENRTGHIKALVGGSDFNRSKFNRAVQAHRQLGSTFKPILYTAAIDRGFTPASIIVDEPVTYPAGGGKLYAPQNYDHKFEGPVTMRRAVEDSRNIPAVKMMNTLGPQNVLNYVARFGFSERFPPYLPIALGAGDATLLELTSAYSVFPNQGVRMKPIDILKVTDRAGNLLEENRSEPQDVIRADTAFIVTNMLRGVVQRGTATAAAKINWPLAGKTGTVDNNTDAWFVGFDPFVTVGVWVGLDEKKPLGARETGAVAALPIWIDVMNAYINARPDKDSPPDFEAPGNIVYLTVDQSTGAVLPQGTAGGFSEAFIAGTQPGAEPFR